MDFQSYLLHPELRGKTDSYLTLRSHSFMRWVFPQEQRISWWGGAVRADGGQGMYMTEPQARAWTEWVVEPGIRIGPF